MKPTLPSEIRLRFCCPILRLPTIFQPSGDLWLSALDRLHGVYFAHFKQKLSACHLTKSICLAPRDLPPLGALFLSLHTPLSPIQNYFTGCQVAKWRPHHQCLFPQASSCSSCSSFAAPQPSPPPTQTPIRHQQQLPC